MSLLVDALGVAADTAVGALEKAGLAKAAGFAGVRAQSTAISTYASAIQTEFDLVSENASSSQIAVAAVGIALGLAVGIAFAPELAAVAAFYGLTGLTADIVVALASAVLQNQVAETVQNSAHAVSNLAHAIGSLFNSTSTATGPSGLGPNLAAGLGSETAASALAAAREQQQAALNSELAGASLNGTESETVASAVAAADRAAAELRGHLTYCTNLTNAARCRNGTPWPYRRCGISASRDPARQSPPDGFL
jgi:hypothetical protein